MFRSVPDRWVLVILLLLLLRYAALSAHVHPFGDDWSYAVKGQEHGLWERLVLEYRHWNGRFFSNVLVLRGPLLSGMEEGLWRYRSVPVLLLAGMVFVARILLAEMVGDRLTALRKWCAALGFTSLYLHLMPHPGQGLFWYTGAVTYLVPCILLLVWVTLLLRMARTGVPWRRGAYALLAMLISAAVVGSNEVAMVQVLLLAAAWALGHRDRVSVLLLAVAVLSALAVFLAPGNAYRSGLFHGTHDPLLTTYMSAAQFIRFVGWWCLSPAFLLVTFIIWRWGRGLGPDDPLVRSLARLRPGWVLLFTAMAVLPAFAIPYWSTGMLGQHRTANAALFVFLPLIWLAMLGWQARGGLELRSSVASYWEQRPGWLVTALVLCLVLLRNDGAVTSDLLSGRAARYDLQVHDRYAQVLRAARAGQDTLRVPLVADPPRALDLLELREDPRHWMNTSMALYFGAPELQIIAEPRSKAGRIPLEKL